MAAGNHRFLPAPPVVDGLLPFDPAIPRQGFQDQRMVRNLSRRPLYYSGSRSARSSHASAIVSRRVLSTVSGLLFANVRQWAAKARYSLLLRMGSNPRLFDPILHCDINRRSPCWQHSIPCPNRTAGVFREGRGRQEEPRDGTQRCTQRLLRPNQRHQNLKRMAAWPQPHRLHQWPLFTAPPAHLTREYHCG